MIETEYSTIIMHAQTYIGSDESLYTVIKTWLEPEPLYSIEKSGTYEKDTVYTPNRFV